MIKYIILMLMPAWALACFTHDKAYYCTHIESLQKALHQCPERKPSDMTCEQLQTLASRINVLSDELRSDPQAFGQKILALQENIDASAALLKVNANQPELLASLKKNQSQLQECLGVVKWLESPRA